MRVQTVLIAIAISFGTARAAQAVTVQKATFARTQLAFFASLEADVACGGDAGTQTAFVTVFISGGSFVNPFGSGTGTSIDIFNFQNPCTGEFIGDAEGFIQGGVIGPNQPLTSARLTGSGDIPIGFGPGGTVHVIQDLTFTGDGTLSTSRAHSETKSVTTPSGPFTITIQHSADRNRTADVVGTITIDGVVFPVDLTAGATMEDSSSKTITVSKP
jgi:hypothetical protein